MGLSKVDGWPSGVCCAAIHGEDTVTTLYLDSMLIDIHSHAGMSEPDVFRFCSTSDWRRMLKEPSISVQGKGMTVGVHPWDASSWDEADRKALSTVLCLPSVLMVGEIGLDKTCKAPFDHQQSIFLFQLEVAAENKKPVIIHVVKAMAELLAIRKTLTTFPAWIIHGFRGGPEQANQYLSAGFYLSFGKHHNRESLRECPSNRLFLETDENGNIHSLYETAASERGVSVIELESAIEHNFRSLFPTVL